MKCFSCHSVKPGENVSGPTLYRVIGRRIASVPGFTYSPALRDFARKQPRWTRELLFRFAADPEKLVPGTTMVFHGVSDPGERMALIDFLGKTDR
jgi:cytochrome c